MDFEVLFLGVLRGFVPFPKLHLVFQGVLGKSEGFLHFLVWTPPNLPQAAAPS